MKKSPSELWLDRAVYWNQIATQSELVASRAIGTPDEGWLAFKARSDRERADWMHGKAHFEIQRLKAPALK